MRPPSPASPPCQEDLETLRGLVADLAARAAVDLSDRHALARVLEGGVEGSPESAAQLRRLLVLCLRLENGSSEDLGWTGLNHLWGQCRDVLSDFGQSSLRGQAPAAPQQRTAGRHVDAV